MNARHRALALACALAALHCGSGTPSPEARPADAPPARSASAEPAPPQTAPSAEPADGKVLHGRGTLLYRKVDSARMSVDAYLGDEIFLVNDSGMKVPLLASDRVGKDKLQALNGKKVDVEATWSDGELPSPEEAHPVNPDGSPMRRREGYRVLSVKPVE